MKTYAVLLLGVGLLMSACGKEASNSGQSAKEPQSKPSAQEVQHAPANAVPGSYEDWCGGHDVPESQCTLCNPTLAAAFKATNDWCVEHGLPESHCRKCNPDLKIVRPPKPEGM